MNRWESLAARLRPQRSARPQAPFQAVNLTRHAVLAANLVLASTPQTRGKGLLGRNSLAPGEGLWIVPCQAIHMFFMRFSIDLVYIDRRKRVRKVRSNVAPWRISACLTAHSVLELPAGIVRKTGTRRGDILEISLIPPPDSANVQEEFSDASTPAQSRQELQNRRSIDRSMDARHASEFREEHP